MVLRYSMSLSVKVKKRYANYSRMPVKNNKRRVPRVNFIA